VATLLIDGTCGFCRRSADWLLAWGCQVEVTPWQRYPLETIPLAPARADEVVHLVDESALWVGHEAIGEALTRSTRSVVRAVGRVVRAPALDWFWSRAYALVAANRHRLPGGTASCRLD
jgi:predicted DCC family thiol-disulfide oxidoreductase YuxK